MYLCEMCDLMTEHQDCPVCHEPVWCTRCMFCDECYTTREED